MAVAAVLLGTVVASSLSGGPPGERRASFVFDVENDSVLVEHYGGDVIDGANLAVESGERGRLGTFDGSDGRACVTNVSRVRRGTVCRVPGGAYERLLVVWEGPDNRSLILARRAADPTPTTRPPTATPPRTGTGTATFAGTTQATPTATVSGPTDTATATPVSTPSSTPTSTPSPTPTPTVSPAPNAVATPTPTASREPNAVPASTSTNATATGG